jgi:hypothetical protein
MSKPKLPKRIPELNLCATKTEMEMAAEIRRYNGLPVGHPDRQGIYDKILDLKEYSDNWD